MIIFDHVSKVYPNGTVGLDDVNLTIQDGEFVAIIGRSGAGKSTLLRSVNRMHQITSGTLTVNGTDVSTLSGKSLRRFRRGIGMVFQSFNLVTRTTVIKNVLSACVPDMPFWRVLLGAFRKADKIKALESLDKVGILDKAYIRADQLSGGQQQRVALARTLTQDPQIILADEPVAALDPVTAKQVMQDFVRINQEMGISILLNIHHVELALEYADRIIGIRAGKIVYDGPAEKKHIFYHSKNSEQAGELDFTYYSAVRTVENALSKVKDEKGMKRVEKFLRQDICPDCGGSRLCAAARAPRLQGIPLDEACRMTLSDLVAWVSGVPAALPEEMRPMAQSICESFQTVAKRLMDLGLGYLALDRAAATLSTGERQRMQLARAVRNRTTGVLYVLDEPSIGLHPANITGLTGVMQDLIHDGNSVILVDHDTQILSEADWLIEMGPQAGAGGGQVIAQGSIPAIEANAASRIGPFLAGKAQCLRPQAPQSELFALGRIQLSTNAIHTVKPLDIEIPKGRLTVVTGVSGSGKTTLVLESLVPGLNAAIHGQKLPEHVRSIVPDGITQVKLIDAAPIGINVRSTVATYANVHDELRKKFAATPDARQAGYKAGDFSYNTGKLRCPVCDGTGSISLDVQFLPDVEIPCPECRGSRYAKEAGQIFYTSKSGTRYSLPQLMDMDVNTALTACADWPVVRQRLTVLQELGLGYLTLGEETPGLSGGEAQRLKLASEMGKAQSDSLFVFDEPTIGLHPADVQVLLGVFQTLIEHGATVIVIEHDLDVIRNADYIIDMGPGGGAQGGTVVAAGTPDVIRHTPASQTGKFI